MFVKYRSQTVPNCQQVVSRVSFSRKARFWASFLSENVGKSSKLLTFDPSVANQTKLTRCFSIIWTVARCTNCMQSCNSNFTFWLTLTLKFRRYESETLCKTFRNTKRLSETLSLVLMTPAFSMVEKLSDVNSEGKGYCFTSLHRRCRCVKCFQTACLHNNCSNFSSHLVSLHVTKPWPKVCFGLKVFVLVLYLVWYWNCHTRFTGR